MTPDLNSSLGIVTLRSGETALLSARPTPAEGDTTVEPQPSGVIYTDQSGPSLEKLLADHEVITAVLERPAPVEISFSPGDATAGDWTSTSIGSVSGGTQIAGSDDSLHEVIRPGVAGPVAPVDLQAFSRAIGGSRTAVRSAQARTHAARQSRVVEAVAFAAITGAVSAVGWLLLISSVISGHLRANPFIALSLALGGLGLTITVGLAARYSPGE